MSSLRGQETRDVVDDDAFALLPPCADPRFDHRSCDYWEDGVRGSKTARPSWWQTPTAPAPAPVRRTEPDNPFAGPSDAALAFNPFAAPTPSSPTDVSEAFGAVAPDDPFGTPVFNPFAPSARPDPGPSADGPRKLRLLSRGLGSVGSYAKVLLIDGLPAAYSQFGPLSAYPRAQHIRELYPSLPMSPLPAVITCVATARHARGLGLGRLLVAQVVEDLARRGFAAVEAYPDLTLSPDEASAAHPAFWSACEFDVAAQDERFPVMRRELG